MIAAPIVTFLLAQNAVRYVPKESDLKYTFGVAQPVATVKPGDTLATVTGDNPLTGRFYVEGAEPGDTLAVEILQLDVDSDQGVGAHVTEMVDPNYVVVASVDKKYLPPRKNGKPW